MSLKLYVVGRERRRQQTPVQRERRAGRAGAGGMDYIALPDGSVSRRHAVIYVTERRIYLRDLGSKNGTFLLEDGKFRRVSEAYVTGDQTVRFGRYRCQVADLVPE